MPALSVTGDECTRELALVQEPSGASAADFEERRRCEILDLIDQAWERARAEDGDDFVDSDSESKVDVDDSIQGETTKQGLAVSEVAMRTEVSAKGGGLHCLVNESWEVAQPSQKRAKVCAEHEQTATVELVRQEDCPSEDDGEVSPEPQSEPDCDAELPSELREELTWWHDNGWGVPVFSTSCDSSDGVRCPS
eukprot:CAMPEP_0194532508 /NCGR_PEP_ID=MMETSP0253-20130528/70083_1 /TAXON_ID=2966 /ORGANISM="Noctiluca scintillans" /LENGTH=193 /DNA_ID=CAMNT_0039377961 /DNA_START=65 /DNA_END=646 /DNA_ORIENTATION=+